MNKLFTAALGLAVALLPVLGVGVATAADVRQPVEIDVAKACGVVTLTFTNPADTKHVFRWNAVAGNKVTDEGLRTGTVTVRPKKTVKETIRFDEDEFKGTAAVTVAVVAGPDSDIQKPLDIYPVDTNCEKGTQPTDEPDPTPTPTPTPTPAPTTEPAPTTTSEFPVDLDCSDLSDAEAQKVLDADTSDPHNLDSDEDGLACDEIVDTASNDTVVTPSGGVNTGAGPA